MSQLRKPFVVVTDYLLTTVMQFMDCVIFLVMITGVITRSLITQSHSPTLAAARGVKSGTFPPLKAAVCYIQARMPS